MVVVVFKGSKRAKSSLEIDAFLKRGRECRFVPKDERQKAEKTAVDRRIKNADEFLNSLCTSASAQNNSK